MSEALNKKNANSNFECDTGGTFTLVYVIIFIFTITTLRPF